jgi:hypothetical protein
MSLEALIFGDRRVLDPSTDKRMWRLLRARLHPDAGGDTELFLFATALLERIRDAELPGDKPEITGTEISEDQFLQSWRITMDRWASRNHETLSSFRGAQSPLISTRD